MAVKTLFYDDVYRFLYSSNMFQQLTEEEQQRFLAQFARNEQFIKSLAVAIDFQAHLGQMEATVPVIAGYEVKEPCNDASIQRKLIMKDQSITTGNVTYVPFGQKVDVAAPLNPYHHCIGEEYEEYYNNSTEYNDSFIQFYYDMMLRSK